MYTKHFVSCCASPTARLNRLTAQFALIQFLNDSAADCLMAFCAVASCASCSTRGPNEGCACALRSSRSAPRRVVESGERVAVRMAASCCCSAIIYAWVCSRVEREDDARL